MSSGGETYEHADLVVAATLFLNSITEINMERRGDQVVWTYAKTSQLEKMLFDIHTGNCQVEPMAFARALRTMRGRVYDLMGTSRSRVARAS